MKKVFLAIIALTVLSGVTQAEEGFILNRAHCRGSFDAEKLRTAIGALITDNRVHYRWRYFDQSDLKRGVNRSGLYELEIIDCEFDRARAGSRSSTGFSSRYYSNGSRSTTEFLGGRLSFSIKVIDAATGETLFQRGPYVAEKVEPYYRRQGQQSSYRIRGKYPVSIRTSSDSYVETREIARARIHSEIAHLGATQAFQSLVSFWNEQRIARPIDRHNFEPAPGRLDYGGPPKSSGPFTLYPPLED